MTQVFKQLFIDGTPEEVGREVERIKHRSEHPRRRGA